MALRDGVHDGLAQKECVNRAPSRAMRSNVGVRTVRPPLTPVSRHDWSSLITKRMLGRREADVSAAWATSDIPRRASKQRVDCVMTRNRQTKFTEGMGWG